MTYKFKCIKYLRIEGGVFWMAGDVYEMTMRDIYKIFLNSTGMNPERFAEHFQPMDDRSAQQLLTMGQQG